MVRAHTSVFLYNDENAKFTLHFLDSGVLCLNVDNHSMFMTQEQVKQLISAIGEIYWELVPQAELEDPWEEYNED